ncbi:YdeI/OmpD-associated family protein [Tumebacillus permanentifrigoris]|uniref:Bacteriocin resistance YdeI/OmpD-like protein n=1 Tax=Tumebacillus permanentifrigoris TaxID=378543 RepID=A0A316DFW2_9BACL|nr:YdeI/OmpD-associated family protein [Tumebacillus permanentifrigoris]PWK16432.1 bacteriocin resistance YdeI/OmpD-like protein [Tumebacillus permanentifrigoris]
MASELAVKKLRMREDGKSLLLHLPEGYVDLLGDLAGFDVRSAVDEPGTFDFVQVFVQSVAELEQHAPQAIGAVKPDGLLWICYPKKSGKIKTDITRDQGWQVVEALGYDGVSIVSLDETWSALRFRPMAQIKTRTDGEGAPQTRKERAAAREKAPADPNRTVEVPADLQMALEGHEAAQALFDTLSYSQRKEYVEWITSAKREETRTRRVGQAIEKLEEGKKRPSGM